MTKGPVRESSAQLALEVVDRTLGRLVPSQSAEFRLKQDAIDTLRTALKHGTISDALLGGQTDDDAN